MKRFFLTLNLAPGLPRSVLADRLHRTRHQRFLAQLCFFGRLRLFIDIRVTVLVIPRKVRGRGVAAYVAIYAIVIDVVFTGVIVGEFVLKFSHLVVLIVDG
jgi:hypothetical protein